MGFWAFGSREGVLLVHGRMIFGQETMVAEIEVIFRRRTRVQRTGARSSGAPSSVAVPKLELETGPRNPRAATRDFVH